MGKRTRKTAKQKLSEEENCSPVEKVVSTLKNLGFGPNDVDLGIEVIEAIEAIVGSPIQSLRRESPVSAPIVEEVIEKSTPAKPVGNLEKGKGVETLAAPIERVEEPSASRKLWSEVVEEEEKGRKAWADVVKQSPTLHRDQILEFIPPSPEGVVITEEDCKEGEELWKFAVIGYALGQKPGFQAMQKYVRSLWKEAAPSVYLLHPGVFLFNFSSEEKMKKVMGARWTFNRAPLIFKKWSPDMRLETLRPEKIAVWIRISGLELNHWSNTVLSKLASFVGRPLQTDLQTAVRERINFARILVEVEVNSKLPDSIPMVTKDGTAYAPVLYEWYPAVCPACSKWGHKEIICPNNSNGKGGEVVKQVGETKAPQRGRNAGVGETNMVWKSKGIQRPAQGNETKEGSKEENSKQYTELVTRKEENTVQKNGDGERQSEREEAEERQEDCGLETDGGGEGSRAAEAPDPPPL